ncbi:mycofactocin precursor MftA [Nocardioides maradonensis]
MHNPATDQPTTATDQADVTAITDLIEEVSIDGMCGVY